MTEVNVLIKMNKFSRDPFNLVIKELTGCKEQIFHLLMIFTVETAWEAEILIKTLIKMIKELLKEHELILIFLFYYLCSYKVTVTKNI